MPTDGINQGKSLPCLAEPWLSDDANRRATRLAVRGGALAASRAVVRREDRSMGTGQGNWGMDALAAQSTATPDRGQRGAVNAGSSFRGDGPQVGQSTPAK